jgi:hypothetical protein
MAALPDKEPFHHEALMTRTQANRDAPVPIRRMVIETAAPGYLPDRLYAFDWLLTSAELAK